MQTKIGSCKVKNVPNYKKNGAFIKALNNEVLNADKIVFLIFNPYTFLT